MASLDQVIFNHLLIWLVKRFVVILTQDIYSQGIQSQTRKIFLESNRHYIHKISKQIHTLPKESFLIKLERQIKLKDILLIKKFPKESVDIDYNTA